MASSYREAQVAARALAEITQQAFEGAPGVEIAEPTLNRVGSQWFAEVRVRAALGEIERP